MLLTHEQFLISIIYYCYRYFPVRETLCSNDQRLSFLIIILSQKSKTLNYLFRKIGKYLLACNEFLFFCFFNWKTDFILKPKTPKVISIVTCPTNERKSFRTETNNSCILFSFQHLPRNPQKKLQVSFLF